MLQSMRKAAYNSVCVVVIQRKNALERIALRQGTRQITRARSMHNLNQISPQSTPLRQPHPLDITKIKSILKKPSDKPHNIFNRRQSLPASVHFDDNEPAVECNKGDNSSVHATEQKQTQSTNEQVDNDEVDPIGSRIQSGAAVAARANNLNVLTQYSEDEMTQPESTQDRSDPKSNDCPSSTNEAAQSPSASLPNVQRNEIATRQVPNLIPVKQYSREFWKNAAPSTSHGNKVVYTVRQIKPKALVP